MAELTELIGPRTTNEIEHPRFGPLHKAEIVVDEINFKPFLGETRDVENHLDAGSYGCVTEYFLRGRLSDGTPVRTAKELINAKTNVKGIPKEEWGDLIQKINEAETPDKGDIVAVYWFSKGDIPSEFHGETYVNVIPADLKTGRGFRKNVLSRTSGDKDIDDYLEGFESFLPSTENFKAEWKGARKKFVGAMKKLALDLKSLFYMDIEEVRKYAIGITIQDEKTVREFEKYQDKMEPHFGTCFRKFASYNVERAAALAVSRKGYSDPQDAIEKVDQIKNAFYNEFINNLDEMFSRRPANLLGSVDLLEPAVDIIYHAHQAFQSAVRTVYGVYGRSFKTLPGCFGHSKKR